jgi:hypothetical protein
VLHANALRDPTHRRKVNLESNERGRSKHLLGARLGVELHRRSVKLWSTHRWLRALGCRMTSSLECGHCVECGHVARPRQGAKALAAMRNSSRVRHQHNATAALLRTPLHCYGNQAYIHVHCYAHPFLHCCAYTAGVCCAYTAGVCCAYTASVCCACTVGVCSAYTALRMHSCTVHIHCWCVLRMHSKCERTVRDVLARPI